MCRQDHGWPLLKGEYTGYGKVEVLVVHDMSLFEKYVERCAAERAESKLATSRYWNEWAYPRSLYRREKHHKNPSIEAGASLETIQLEQFEEYWRCWHGGWTGWEYTVVQGDVFATDIYCCGDKAKIAEQAKQGKSGRSSKSSDESDESGEYGERYCVPDGIEWKDYLLKSEVKYLPRVVFEGFPNEKEVELWKYISGSEEWKRQLRGEQYLTLEEKCGKDAFRYTRPS